MNNFFSLFLAAVFLIAPINASATEVQASNKISEALDASLHKHPLWQKLLHFESGRFSSNSISAIHSPEFFLSKEGRHNAREELTSTISAFFETPDDHNDHALCRFPARFQWLNKQLNFNEDALPKVNCEHYQIWNKEHQIESVSMVYATGYLGNPASYYGHILLKLNEQAKAGSNSLLDTSVNFGAIVPDAENPVSYILKGLFGGYDSGFTHISYYFHTHNYGENELRDLWEYELNLNDVEVEFLVAHTWELLGKKYDYYFLDKNCAFRMAELLELYSDIKLVSGREFWLTPQEVIQNIFATSRNNDSIKEEPLVKKITYISSRQSKLYHRYNLLDANEKALLSVLITDIDELNGSEFRARQTESQHRLIDTLLDYYQFIEVQLEIDEVEHEEKYRKVLSKRFELPPSPGIDINNQQEANGPHLGRPASRAALSYLHNKKFGNGASLKLRPAYYDELDAQEGHIKNAKLFMSNFEADVFDHSLKVRLWDLVSINSVQGQSTMLPGDKNFAWKLYLGLQKQGLNCRSCLVPRFGSDAGLTFNHSNTSSLSVFAGGMLQDKKNGFGHAYGRASVLAIHHFTQAFNAKVEVEYRRHLDSETKEEVVSELALRYGLSREHDLRLSIKEHEIVEAELELGFYF